MDGSPSSFRAVLVLTVMMGLFSLLSATPSEGQTTSITSSGLGTTISPASIDPAGRPNYVITGGTRPGDGPNLFHSFGDFSIGTNNVARFLNESGRATTNILSRVTGGQPSNVFGTIQTAGFGTAALWLINPAGIVFGPSASLNVGGSVHFSTADYLRLGSGNDRFYANLGKTSQLTSAPVTAFGFLGSSPGKIDVQGGVGSSTLSGSDGHSFSLVGGDISIEGRTIQASGGQINLVSVSAGEVSLTPNGPQLSQGSVLGNISLTAKPPDAVNKFPTPTVLTSNASELNSQAGDIFIRSGHLVMGDSSLSAFAQTASGNDPSGFTSGGNILLTAADMNLSNSSLSASTIGNTKAGSITLQGQDIVLQNTTLRAPSNLSLNDFVREPTGGQAGSVTITGIDGPAQNVSLNNSTITTEIQTAGAPGTPPAKINISSQAVTLTDGASITAKSTGAAPAGNINVDAGTLTMNPGTSITASTSGSGNAGNISITASDHVTLSGPDTKVSTDTSSTGNAGSLSINANQLTINKFGRISSSSTSKSGTAGSAGNIVIRGQAGGDSYAESVVLEDGTIATTIAGGTELSTPASIDIRGQSVTLANAGGITASTGGVDPVGTDPNGPHIGAPGGNISLNVASLSMNSEPPFPGFPSRTAGIVANTAGPGQAGNITIHATDHVTLSGAQISSSSNGTTTGEFPGHCSNTCGQAGDITITAPALTLEAVESTQFIGLRKVSGIGASTSGSGAAGTISLAVGSVLINDSNPPPETAGTIFKGIDAGTSGSGAGGTIDIRADSIRLDGGFISSQQGKSNAGAPGNIDIAVGQLALLDGSLIRANNNGSTAGGTLTIHGKGSAFADTVSISHSTLSTGTTSTAKGGPLNIAANTIDLTDGAQINSTATGAGAAGNITLTSRESILIANSTVSTEATQASGGNIRLNAPNTVRLSHARLTSSVKGPANSDGGNITIGPLLSNDGSIVSSDIFYPQFVVIQDASQILAKANEGEGGRIRIIGNVVLRDAGSVLDATAGPAGISGTVNIQSPFQQLSGAIAPLPQAFAMATNLYGQRCAAEKGGQFSSFVQGARDGVPPQPGDLIPSPLLLELDEVPLSTGLQSTSSLSAIRLGLPEFEQTSRSSLTVFSGCRS